MLGLLTGFTGIASREAMERANKDRGAEELNLKAFRRDLEITTAGDERR